MNSSQPAGISKNRLPKAWQSHVLGSGGHQTCHYRRQVPAIGANSIRGRLGHYRTGFRRPSQDRRHRLFRPASIKAIAQSGRNASLTTQKIWKRHFAWKSHLPLTKRCHLHALFLKARAWRWRKTQGGDSGGQGNTTLNFSPPP